MATQLALSRRQANLNDQRRLANLIHFETTVHRHLDWRAPLEWIGHEPFLVAEHGKEIVAALACPPDPPRVAWIRLFAVSSDIGPEKAWQSLWPIAYKWLNDRGNISVAVIPLQDWFRRILITSSFELINQVIMLEWKHETIPSPINSLPIQIRSMRMDDLPVVEGIDQLAFSSIWQNSEASLEYAFRLSALATVAEHQGHIVGYQISTTTQMGGHLARLAIHPDYQRMGVGRSLLLDLLQKFTHRGAQRVTVNTQQDNAASISLYEKAGFKITGETYPVYQFNPIDKSSD